ncbi:Fc.00g030250.m01.CDS01 [Cosmosporella sp. VM-42]
MASSSKPEGSLLWALSQLHRFFGRVLYKQDILGIVTFARANAKSCIITQEEFEKIEGGLKAVEKEWEKDQFVIISSVDENTHTANEHRLGEIIGKDVAGKLHTGCSRNEPVGYDMRAWLQDELRRIDECLTHSRFHDDPEGSPSTYNKDLKESFEPMMDHVKTVSDSIQIANRVWSTLTTGPEKMKTALVPFMLATDMADYLVRNGIPFRETHHISDRCVAKSEETGTLLDQFTCEQIKAIDEHLEKDLADVFNYETSVEGRSAQGGISKATVLEQIKVLKEMLA